MRNLIFAKARTGSTSLAKIVSLHQDTKCSFEPFNPDYIGTKKIFTFNELKSELNQIFTNYNLVKHIYNTEGYPFENNPILNRLLVSEVDNVLLLQRKNLLKRILSIQISKQVNIWHFDREKDWVYLNQFKFKAINPDIISTYLQKEFNFQTEFEQYLKQNNINYIITLYENIFSETEDSYKANAPAEINRIMKFFGLTNFGVEAYDNVAELLSPNNKMNFADNYVKIPNIVEINDLFSNEVNGRLFSDL